MTEYSLRGRTAIITGASGGFGKAVATAFWRSGASLYLTGRSEERLQRLQNELIALPHADQELAFGAFDLLEHDGPRLLVEDAVSRLGTPAVLVNNAAVQVPIGPLWENDTAEWRRTVETNLFVPAELCARVIPLMIDAGYGKIINLSGGGATGPRPNFSAYAASKAALVRLTEVVAEETRRFGIDCNAIAPGAMNTTMLNQVLAAGSELSGTAEYAKAHQQLEQGGTPPERGAALAVYLASPNSDGVSGRLISAVWDPWNRLPDLAARLSGNDIYTLRRIVPRDRELDWGNE